MHTLRLSKMSRRSMLAGAGGAGLLPFVPIFNRDVEAQGGLLPKRFVVVVLPNWHTDINTRCEGSGANFTFSDAYKSLEPFRSDLLIMDGMDNEACYRGQDTGGHEGNRALLTGIGSENSKNPSGPSIDQWIAQQPNNNTLIPSLVLGAGTRQETGPDDVISHAGKDQPIAAEANPGAVWDQIFKDFTVDPTERNSIRDGNVGVLDNVATQLTNLKRVLPRDDQLKLEAHLQGITELGQQVKNAVYDCTVPGRPTDFGNNAADMLHTSALQMDLITTAMACDATRVASLYYGLERRGPTMSWVGASNHFHDTSHSSLGDGKYTSYNAGRKWLVEQFAGLVGRFKQVPEGNGTMLDNSIVMLTSCMGNSNTHGNRSIPFVLAGKAGGALAPGKYFRYGTWDIGGGSDKEHGGETANRVYLSVANAMGYPIKVFGDPDLCQKGPLSELHT